MVVHWWIVFPCQLHPPKTFFLYKGGVFCRAISPPFEHRICQSLFASCFLFFPDPFFLPRVARPSFVSLYWLPSIFRAPCFSQKVDKGTTSFKIIRCTPLGGQNFPVSSGDKAALFWQNGGTLVTCFSLSVASPRELSSYIKGVYFAKRKVRLWHSTFPACLLTRFFPRREGHIL